MPIYYEENSFCLRTKALKKGILACLGRISTNHVLRISSLWFRYTFPSLELCLIRVKSTQGGIGARRFISFARALRENEPHPNICLCGLSDVTGPSTTVFNFMMAFLERSVLKFGPWGWPRKSCGLPLIFSLSTHVPQRGRRRHMWQGHILTRVRTNRRKTTSRQEICSLLGARPIFIYLVIRYHNGSFGVSDTFFLLF